MYLDRGGDPRVLNDVSWRDIDAWLSIVDLLEARSSLGGVPEK